MHKAPQSLMLFSALYGAGVQLVFMVLFSIVIAALGTFYSGFLTEKVFFLCSRRGTIMSIAVGIYAVTSFISGFASGSFYAHHNGNTC